MKIELNKDVRIIKDENYDVLRSIERNISERIRLEFLKEISDIKLANETLISEEKEFTKEAKELLKKITPDTLLKVKTQTGKGSTTIREYIGSIQRKFNHGDGTFNFISPEIYDGKPFTIGFSCLLSIEII